MKVDGDKYADRQATDHSGHDGAPIKREVAVYNFTFVPRTHRVTIEGQIVPRGPSPLSTLEATPSRSRRDLRMTDKKQIPPIPASTILEFSHRGRTKTSSAATVLPRHLRDASTPPVIRAALA
jgi:hypothetical protein